METTYQLHKNGNYYQATWRNSRGQRVRKSLGRVTKTQANAILQRMIAEHTLNPVGRDITADPRLAEWGQRYLRLREAELSPATMKVHSRTCDLLTEWFDASVRLGDLTAARMSDWRLGLVESGMKESTVCKYSRAAKVILEHAILEGLLVVNPARHLTGSPKTVDAMSRRVVSLGEVQKVADQSPEIARLLFTCYYSGLRIAEALSLTDDDFMSDRLRVRTREGVVTTKQRGRVVRVEPELSPILEAGLPLIAPKRAGMVWKLLRQACVDAGVEPFTFKDLRSTRDTLWHQQFESHVVCYWMGHSESTARKHYLSVTEDHYARDNHHGSGTIEPGNSNQGG